MTTNNNPLRYADETDKAFGLAGMAIALVAWDAEDWLEGIDLDAAPEEAMHLSADYGLYLAPRTGAKASWSQALKRFQIAAAMTVANVACRQMVHQAHSALSSQIDSALRSLLDDEGAELCSLEPDEVSRVYGQSLTHCARMFRHPGVGRLAGRLADALASERTLSAPQIFEILAPLNQL